MSGVDGEVNCKIIPFYVVKAQRGMYIYLHSCLAQVLERATLLASNSGRFIQGKVPSVSTE
jgi:hypothetical protein